MGVKLVCAAAAVILAVGQVAHLPKDRRSALWSSAGRLLGMETPPIEIVAPPRASPDGPAFMPAAVTGYESIEPDRFGQFPTSVEIEGRSIPVVIDTGASMVCLNFDEADRLGYRPSPSDFRYMVHTANGQVAYAKVTLREIRLGSIMIRDVTALVAPRGALGRGLLGMNFLARLSSFRTEGGKLILQP